MGRRLGWSDIAPLSVQPAREDKSDQYAGRTRAGTIRAAVTHAGSPRRALARERPARGEAIASKHDVRWSAGSPRWAGTVSSDYRVCATSGVPAFAMADVTTVLGLVHHCPN